MKNISLTFLFILGLYSCESTQMVSVEDWGYLPDGQQVQLYTLKNQTGMQVKISNYGGIITHMTSPDRHGAFADVVLGYDNLAGYLKSSPYFGAVVGRFANRIKEGKFTLNDSTYTLAVNNAPNHLHGGLKGLDKALWKTEIVSTNVPSIKLHYVSPDGEEGYPGKLNLYVTYTLNHQNQLKIDYYAETDQTTHINLSNHTYFNLNLANGNILQHELTLHSDSILAVDKTLIPKGSMSVTNTPFDFKAPKKIGERIKDTSHEQIVFGGGYDHCYIIKPQKSELKSVGSVIERFSGRKMEVLTTEPAVQLYTGNFLDGSIIGKGRKKYDKNMGFCLETQHYPDSPNQPIFPSTLLIPGKPYSSTTIYSFKAI